MVSMTIPLEESFVDKLERFSWVNWSELAREELIKQEEKTTLFEQLEEFSKDSELTDKDALRLGRKVNDVLAKRYGLLKKSKGAK